MLHEAELRIKKLEKEALRQTESGADAKQCFQRSWVYPIAGWFISMENPNFIPKLWMVYFMENPIKRDNDWGTPTLGKLQLPP